MSGEERAAMKVVGAALGNNLNLGSAEAAKFSIVAIGENFHALYGIFRGGNDCRSTPDGAGGADAVDHDAVVFILLASGQSLRAVFGLENALIASGPAGTLGSGKVCALTAGTLRAVAENARR